MIVLSSGLNYKGNKSFRLINVNERLHKDEILNRSGIAIVFSEYYYRIYFWLVTAKVIQPFFKLIGL